MPPNFNDGGRASAYVYGGGYGAGAAARRGSTGSTGGSNAEKAEGTAAAGAGADGGAEKPLRNFELLYDEVIRRTDDLNFTRTHSTHSYARAHSSRRRIVPSRTVGGAPVAAS